MVEKLADHEPIDPRMMAGLDMLGRTGMTEAQIRYSDDEEPTVWFVVARFEDRYEVAADLEPTRAMLKLCEQIIDGGTCTHCHKPTGIIVDDDGVPPIPLVCWYTYDAESKSFKRGCE